MPSRSSRRPVHARRRQYDRRGHLRAVVEDQLDGLVVAVQPAARDAAQEHQLGAEAFRLPTGQPRQLGAADPVREAEEVLDHRRVRGLAARHVAGRRRSSTRPSGGGVDGGGEARRPGADDDEVVVLPLWRLASRPTQSAIDSTRRARERLARRRRRRAASHRSARAASSKTVGLGRARLVPLVRLRGARQEVAEPVVLGVHPPTDDLHRWTHRAHARSIVVTRYRVTE